MSNFRILSVDTLTKELDRYKFKQLHIHHTWKPTHRNFNGKNHVQLQQNMKNYHVKTLGWSDIGQHLTLMPDGKYVTGRPFNRTPSSISGWNTGALAVEMLGNFDKVGTKPYNDLGYDELEGEQLTAVLKLMKWFGDKYGYGNIKFHRDNPTAGKSCPGTSLNKQYMINEAKKIGTKSEEKQGGIKVDNTKPSAWAKEAWDWAVKNGITDGSNPKGTATREEIVTMLYRAKGGK